MNIPDGERRLGKMLPNTDRCPLCNSRLMGNPLGSRWCVSDMCGYHVRIENGRMVSVSFRTDYSGDFYPDSIRRLPVVVRAAGVPH